MVFGIFIAILLAAIGFFHWIQGFFSSVLSAVISVVSAVIALSYYESIVDGPLAGYSPGWIPTLVLLALFALPYVILRTLFDKAIPAQVQLPAMFDKVGGAVMGVVAGAFALGIVVIGAQLMPFGASVGGYTRYETTGLKNVTIPGSGVGRAAARKDGATFDELVAENFQKSTKTPLLGGMLPVDDIVVATVAHLSDQGSLSAGRPFRSVHPDLLQELYGQRAGVETGVTHTIVNTPGKTSVEVAGVYKAPPIPDQRIVDHEFSAIRGGTVLKLPGKVPSDEVRLVVRVKFADSAAGPKENRRLRISPGGVRLVGKRPPELGAQPEPFNYFPIGTLDPQPGGYLYLHKPDDYLFVDLLAKKVDGTGDAGAEVDFVFQVKREGMLAADDSQLLPGTFLEVKRARIDLSSGELATVKPTLKRLPVLAVRRKKLDGENGPAPMVPGAAPAAAAVATPEPAAPAVSAGGGVLGQRLIGEWKTGGGVTASEVLTFAADGTMTSTVGGGAQTPMRWIASGSGQGETLTIRTAAGIADPSSGEQRTLVFEDENQFSMTDSVGNRRFTRVGDAASAQPAPAPAPAANLSPDVAMSKMAGTWENAAGLKYVFRIDGTYSASNAAGKSANGTWKVISVDGGVANIELQPASGAIAKQTWQLDGPNPNELNRTEPAPPTPFTRKS